MTECCVRFLLTGAGWTYDEAAGGLLFEVGLFLAVDEIESAFLRGRGVGQCCCQRAERAAYFLTFLQNHGRAVIDGG